MSWFRSKLVLLTALCAVASTPTHAQSIDELKEQLRQTRQQVEDAASIGMDPSILAMLRENLQIAEEAVREMEADAENEAKPHFDPQQLPEQLASLQHTTTIPIDMTPATWATVSFQFFVCDRDRLWLSFSPQLPPGIEAIDFEGSAFPIGRSFSHKNARPEPQLGCGAQGVDLGSIMEFEERIVQHQFTSGDEVWNTPQMVQHFLGSLSINTVSSRKIPK